MDSALHILSPNIVGAHYHYISITDPIPDEIDGSSVINKILHEVICGIISLDELRHWADELEREGFCELAYEIHHRLGGA
jgi:hypothetical protein